MPNIEIIPRYSQTLTASELLYTPVSDEVTCRETLRYDLNTTGDETALRTFIENTLGDPHSLDIHWDNTPALQGYRHILDIGMKPKTLDLQREYILNYQKSLTDPQFQLNSLQIYRRIYIFGPDLVPIQRFTKDLVNPVIQHAHTTTAP